MALQARGPSSAIRCAWRGQAPASLYAREPAGVAAPVGLSLMGVCHGGKLVRSAHCCSPHPTARGAEDRMQVERQMDMADNDDMLILSALMETEAVLANEVGLLLLRKLREKVSAA